MIQKLIFLIAFVSFSVNVLAQSAGEFAQKYNSGKQLLSQKKYDLARQVFQPLTQDVPGNPYPAYAQYYQAYAAFKSGKLDDARTYLQQLTAKHPTWDRADDAYYLQGNVAFERKDYAGAFAALKKIKSKKIQDEADRMKTHYAAQVTDVAALKKLQAQFPDDKALASALVDRLLTSSESADAQLARQLDEKFKLNKAADLDALKKVSKKDSYNVAVLFPFLLESLASNKARSNQFALDMYNGIKIAQQDLTKQGVNLNVYAYDVSNDTNKMLNLINSPDFSAMDLLVGPLYASTNKVAVSFANQRNVALVNPISTNAQLIQNSPSAFLLQPSAETQARHAAEYALKTFTSDTVMVFYGNTPRDSAMAHAYRTYVTENGGQVPVFRRVTPEKDSIGKMTAVINEKIKNENPPPKDEDERKLFDENKKKNINVGHIFVATENQNMALNVISGLEQKSSKVPLVVSSDWLDFRMVSFDQLEERNVHFVYPEYIAYGSDAVKNFKRKFIAEHNIIPSVYAYQGYDLMMYFGKLLHQHGTYFQPALHQQPITPGTIFLGYSYVNANDNQYVPIVKFDRAKLTVINPVSEQ